MPKGRVFNNFSLSLPTSLSQDETKPTRQMTRQIIFIFNLKNIIIFKFLLKPLKREKLKLNKDFSLIYKFKTQNENVWATT